MLNSRVTTVQQSKVKKSKVNESKEKDIPTYKEFSEYVISNIPDIDKHYLELKYKSWIANNWRDGNNKPIKNWKSKALNACAYLPKSSTQKGKPELSDYQKELQSKFKQATGT